MAYFTNRLNEALAKLDDIDEAIGELMRCEKSARDPLTAAREHTSATTALLDALRDEPPHRSKPHDHPRPRPARRDRPGGPTAGRQGKQTGATRNIEVLKQHPTDEDEEPCEEAA